VLDLAAPVYALDSTFIDLSLALCPWANWTGSRPDNSWNA
jgi:hypothetical protein